jgi:hypothetical protein
MIFTINQKFEYLENLTQMVVNGITPSLILVGEGGSEKATRLNLLSTKQILVKMLTPLLKVTQLQEAFITLFMITMVKL